MSAHHLPVGSSVVPLGVTPLGVDMGIVAGHQIILLSLERWEGWADLRFARIDTGSGERLARRVPPAPSWTVHIDGRAVEVFDAVGRGDRTFSNGEVRLVPPPGPGSQIAVRVELAPGHAPLEAALALPEAGTA